MGSLDENRAFYEPYIDEWQGDSHKLELERGMAGLGLPVVREDHLAGLPRQQLLEYAGAYLQFYAQLDERARLLGLEGGQLDGGILGRRYGGHNLDWAGSYAKELEGLRDVMEHTPVLEYVKQMRKEQAVRAMFRKTVPGYRPVVEYNQKTDTIRVARRVTHYGISQRQKAA